MKLLQTKTIKGKINVLTGLHIGAGNNAIEIGGMDNPIIKNPVTGMPYIPGSSIKGKMRSLSEWRFDKVHASEGRPCSCGKADCKVCRVFGSANNKRNADNGENQKGPTRIIVRDAHISDDSYNAFLQANKPVVEEKNENTLNRITAEANPRPLERVVPGITFDFSISYKIIDTGDGGALDTKYYNEVVLESLKLLEHDYLGGGGSRGSGRIEFINLTDETGAVVLLK